MATIDLTGDDDPMPSSSSAPSSSSSGVAAPPKSPKSKPSKPSKKSQSSKPSTSSKAPSGTAKAKKSKPLSDKENSADSGDKDKPKKKKKLTKKKPTKKLESDKKTAKSKKAKVKEKEKKSGKNGKAQKSKKAGKRADGESKSSKSDKDKKKRKAEKDSKPSKKLARIFPDLSPVFAMKHLRDLLKTDKDLDGVPLQKDALMHISESTTLFLAALVKDAYKRTRGDSRKTVQYDDIAESVFADKRSAFLWDIMPRRTSKNKEEERAALKRGEALTKSMKADLESGVVPTAPGDDAPEKDGNTEMKSVEGAEKSSDSAAPTNAKTDA